MSRSTAVLLAASLFATGCTLAPATPLLQTGGGGYGSVCGPGGSVLIGIDILHNVSDGPVTVDKVELDSPHNVELAGWRLLDDPSQGGPRVNDGVIDGHFGPGQIQPGQIAAVDVALNTTIRDSPGWANGLWVYATGQSSQRVRIHTCFALMTAPGYCSTDTKEEAGYTPDDDQALSQACGRQQRA